MTTAEVLTQLNDVGVILTADGDGLRYKVPKGALSDDLRAAITEHKAVLTLVTKLQAGSRWLTEEHQKWRDDGAGAASDETFSTALSGWTRLERVLRCSGYEACIMGPDQTCPADAPVTCDFCVAANTGEGRVL